MSEHPGTQVAATDLETGENDVVTIKDDYVVICDGNRYIDGIQIYPGTGTAIITVKVKR